MYIDYKDNKDKGDKMTKITKKMNLIEFESALETLRELRTNYVNRGYKKSAETIARTMNTLKEEQDN